MAAYGPPGAPAGGCCAPPGPCNHFFVSVNGCNSKPVLGARIKLLQGGSAVDTQTTDSTGSATITVPTAGTYTLSADPPNGVAWWSTATQTKAPFAVACTGTPSNQSFVLVPATGYQCRCATCRDPVDDGSTRKPTLTDANGTYSMVWDSGRSSYVCCYLITGQTVYSFANLNCVTPTSTGTVAIGYQLLCPTNTTTGWGLTQWYTACGQAPPFKGLPGNCNNPADAAGTFPNDTISGGFGLNRVQGFVSAVAAPNNCNASISFSVANTYVNGTVAVTF